ncbi:hypothetical protein B0H11DRAFT_1984135 [Mycena galericulata]|nr:hypothetical protein B0H11DRAFT_1984135 [Mycena galericulata]
MQTVMSELAIASSPPPASLLDLPNELLLIISQDFSDYDLLHLALICMRLNLLLLPLVFSRLGFEPPSSHISSISFIGTTYVVLIALEGAFFVTSVGELDLSLLNFYHAPRPEILHAVQRLNALATRLSHFAHLRFAPMDIFRHDDAFDLEHWPPAVAALFNAVSQHKDSTITVYAGTYAQSPDFGPFSHVVPRLPSTLNPPRPRPQASLVQTLAKKFRAAWSRLLRSGNSQEAVLETADLLPNLTETLLETLLEPPSRPTIQSTERVSDLTLPVAPRSSLSTFNIHSSFLFHMNFYKWTLQTLNTAPLTALSLDQIDLSLYDWALTLPRLALPALETLAVLRCAIAVPDLTAFLARHPTIRALDLSFHVAIGSLHPSAPLDILPRLETIAGPPDYLLYFLHQASETETEAQDPRAVDDAAIPTSANLDALGPHPRLRTVSIRSHAIAPYDVAQFVRLVACLQARPVIPRVDLAGRIVECCQLPVGLGGEGEGEAGDSLRSSIVAQGEGVDGDLRGLR